MAGVNPTHHGKSVVTYTTHSSSETFQLGKILGQKMAPNTILCFFGDLGAGKTTMIKGVVEGACAHDDVAVTSPTYTYMHIYKGIKTVYHFDLYRLNAEEEFLAMGFDEYFFAGGLCCVEWSEKITSVIERIPESSLVRVEIDHMDEGSRTIRIMQ